MRLKLLNKKVMEDKISSVFFPFPPIALPVSSNGILEKEDAADTAHYTTIVYSLEDKDFFLLV